VAYFGDAAQIGNIWLRRYGSGDKELLDFRIYQGGQAGQSDVKCTIQSTAGSAPQNTVLNIIARWDGSVIELDINGVKASTDCNLVMQNRVLSETYIGSSFIDTSIGGFVDSSRFLLGDIYGMYAWPRHLSNSEAAQVLAGIEIGGPDTLPTLQCCAADGTYTRECGCPESRYAILDTITNTLTLHTDTGSHSWTEAETYAASQGGRLPTLDELRAYETNTGYFAARNVNEWIPVKNPGAPSGADYMMAFNGHGYSIGNSRWERVPSEGDPISSTFGQQEWAGVANYPVWFSSDFSCVQCPTDMTSPAGSTSINDCVSTAAPCPLDGTTPPLFSVASDFF
jgi:hypothetical protein